MKRYKLTLFGVKETTQMIAQHLIAQGIAIDLIVSIDPLIAQKTDVANYVDLKDTAAAIGADYYTVQTYGAPEQQGDFFQENQFEIGLVYGWQRLIPETTLTRFEKGVFGFHASPSHLPQGRGRSPLNWGIILGKTTLYNHCFKYVPEADAGDIYSITPFEITPCDTILTLLYKSLLIAKKEFVKLVRALEKGPVSLTPQEGKASYFPKRSPADAKIDFRTMTTQEIVNLIRGVTKPFSGAFCYTSEGIKITFWEACVFDRLMDFSTYQLGEVIAVIYNMPVILTREGSLIVKRYEGDRRLRPQECLR